MGTYAKWRLWVGVRKGWMDMTEASRHTDEILDKMNDGKSYILHDLKFEAIYMHGGIVGYGVIVSELNWGTDIGKENVFPEDDLKKAKEIVFAVRHDLGQLGINGQVLVLHHIDLGG